MADLSPSIGSLFGVKIELHWSFILLMLLVLFLGAFYLFLILVLLFICVLVHELFHSITSKRNNIPVKKIVLYPMGGGSIIDFEKVGPELEFRISIVGPIASLLLAGVLGIANILTPAGFIRSLLQTLFVLNIFLGVFNLLPWLPLDGGRALRSYLQRTRNFLQATQLSVKVSNAITCIFIIATIGYASLMHGYSLLYRELLVVYTFIIALFIYSGAKYEMQAAFIKENIKGLRATDAATKNYLLLKPNSDTKSLYKTMLKSGTSIVLFKKGEAVQMLSSSALQKMLSKNTQGVILQNLGTPIPSVQYNASLYYTIERMRSDGSNIAAVMKGKSIAGILLMNHAESIIALHISQKRSATRAQRQGQGEARGLRS